MVEVEWIRVSCDKVIPIRPVIVVIASIPIVRVSYIDQKYNHIRLLARIIAFHIFLSEAISIVKLLSLVSLIITFIHVFFGIPRRLKGKFYTTTIRPNLLNSMGCWAVKKLNEFDMSMVEMPISHWMCGSLWEMVCGIKIFMRRYV